ncbi:MULTISPECIES: DUF2490 domain-containing protein [unclassified Lentimicrobium]|uniref:DUF2490 domain-containing protein n=1 Tax=unclassified Lentimicrobium TaxID=2677434 RepID=UPI001557E247|nr:MULTISPECIES: DUF2490 domain-containing protein [unclassified Lentimicrobium]NPD46857.1 DUF2490 domain-containing protein [Lentimicrobium sp. S6]NPD84440.1 DUF2490 domain-containing protein [Lentimicrobium sp. L6]
MINQLVYKYLSILLFVMIGFVIAFPVTAQEEDFQIWGDISAKYKINKKFRLDTQLGIRTRENSELLKQYHWDLGVKYKLNKRFSLGTRYRFIDYYEFGKTSIHRWNLDLVYDNKFGRFSYDIRGRYQQQWFYSNYKQEYSEQLFRSKFELSYDVRKNKIEPFIAIEHYLGLNGELKWLTAQMRYTIGASYPINKWSDLSLAYRIQREYYKYMPLRAYILLVSYSVDLN